MIKKLKELGFEYMPTLNGFVTKIKDFYFSCDLYQDGKYADQRNAQVLGYILKYKSLIDQSPKLADFWPCVDGVPIEPFKGNKYKGNGLVAIGSSNDFTKEYAFYKKQEQHALEQVKFGGGSIVLSSGNVVMHLGFIIDCGERRRYETYDQLINAGVKLKLQ